MQQIKGANPSFERTEKAPPLNSVVVAPREVFRPPESVSGGAGQKDSVRISPVRLRPSEDVSSIRDLRERQCESVVREPAVSERWEYPRKLLRRQCENIAHKTAAFGKTGVQPVICGKDSVRMSPVRFRPSEDGSSARDLRERQCEKYRP